MAFLEYLPNDGYVIKIHETEPMEIGDGGDIAKSDDYQPGDESEYIIYVYPEYIDENGYATKIAAVRQNPKVIMDELKEQKQKTLELQEVIDYLILDAIGERDNV